MTEPPTDSPTDSPAQTLQVGNVTLAYRLLGRGTRPLVCIHGVGSYQEAWDDVATLLADDFRGFWNFSLWIEHDPERDADWSFVSTGRKDPLGAPREVASVLFDDADPERPRRLFADSC